MTAPESYGPWGDEAVSDLCQALTTVPGAFLGPRKQLSVQLIILQLWEVTQQPLPASHPQPPGGAAHSAKPSRAQAGQAASVPTTLSLQN